MSIRIIKINELIKQELSLIIHKELSEKYGIIEVTDVNTSEDMKSAIVYVKSLVDVNRKELTDKLNKMSRFFNGILIKKISAHNVPKVSFIYDDSVEDVNKIEKILTEIEKENADKH